MNNVSLCSWLTQLHLTPLPCSALQIISSAPKQPRCNILGSAGLPDTLSEVRARGLGIRAGMSAEHGHKHPASLPLSQCSSIFVQQL